MRRRGLQLLLLAGVALCVAATEARFPRVATSVDEQRERRSTLPRARVVLTLREHLTLRTVVVSATRNELDQRACESRVTYRTVAEEGSP